MGLTQKKLSPANASSVYKHTGTLTSAPAPGGPPGEPQNAHTVIEWARATDKGAASILAEPVQIGTPITLLDGAVILMPVEGGVMVLEARV